MTGNNPDPHCKIYLVVEADLDHTARYRLDTLLSRSTISCLLIKPGHDGKRHIQPANELINTCQDHDVAALILDDIEIAQTLGADGVHLSWHKELADSFSDARQTLGTTAIIGADTGKSRHLAMTLCENGADYVAFGIPPHVTDIKTAQTRRLELISWWAEIFEVPCVACQIESIPEAAQVAAAGADFAAVTLPNTMTDTEFNTWRSELSRALSSPRKQHSDISCHKDIPERHP